MTALPQEVVAQAQKLSAKTSRGWLATAGAAILGLGILCCPSLVNAAVLVTEPFAGFNISADKALNSTNGPGYTTLEDLVITEQATTDFAVGNNQTLILTLPDGWRFNTSGVSVTWQGSRDITTASIAMTASNRLRPPLF